VCPLSPGREAGRSPQSHKEEQVAENEGQSDTVSKEAHERELRKNASLQEQLDKATAALAGTSKRDKARAYFKEKGAVDPDAAADLATPFLDTVEDNPESIAEALTQDRFKLLLATNPPPSNGEPAGEGEGTGEEPPGATEPAQHGFGGPSPANAGSGGPQVGAEEKMEVGSPQYKALIASGDEEAIKAAYDKGLVSTPTRPY
jgi:hypothetical protein